MTEIEKVFDRLPPLLQNTFCTVIKMRVNDKVWSTASASGSRGKAGKLSGELSFRGPLKFDPVVPFDLFPRVGASGAAGAVATARNAFSVGIGVGSGSWSGS